MDSRLANDPATLAHQFEMAWNAHDMAAFAQLFAPDAHFVSRFGHQWRGRNEIVARHAEIHATIYRDCSISTRVDNVDFIRSDVATVHLRSLVSVGKAMPTGARQFTVQFCYVASYDGDRWLIRSAHNVAVVDPVTGQPLAEF